MDSEGIFSLHRALKLEFGQSIFGIEPKFLFKDTFLVFLLVLKSTDWFSYSVLYKIVRFFLDFDNYTELIVFKLRKSSNSSWGNFRLSIFLI